MNLTGVGSNEAQAARSKGDGTVVVAKKGWGLVVSWRELTIDQEISWLGDIIAWVEIGREVCW